MNSVITHTLNIHRGEFKKTSGNTKKVFLLDFIKQLEKELGKKAIRNYMPLQKGDVANTYADISAIKSDFNFTPQTKLIEGVPKFIDWYKDYHKI